MRYVNLLTLGEIFLEGFVLQMHIHCLTFQVPQIGIMICSDGKISPAVAAQSLRPSLTWLPDGYSQIFRSYVFVPSSFWTMAPLCYAAKFDPFLSLDCAPTRLRKVDFFGWWLEQELPTAQASFSAEKIHSSECGPHPPPWRIPRK